MFKPPDNISPACWQITCDLVDSLNAAEARLNFSLHFLYQDVVVRIIGAKGAEVTLLMPIQFDREDLRDPDRSFVAAIFLDQEYQQVKSGRRASARETVTIDRKSSSGLHK